jgi:hypothetical protein
LEPLAAKLWAAGGESSGTTAPRFVRIVTSKSVLSARSLYEVVLLTWTASRKCGDFPVRLATGRIPCNLFGKPPMNLVQDPAGTAYGNADFDD